MSQEKILLYEDRENGNIVRYKCRKRNISSFEVECCLSSLYAMKLNSSVVNYNVLKEGKETSDLIRELRMIFDDENSSIIDFGNVLGLFNMNKVNPAVIKAPIKSFLGMYEVEKDSECSKKDLLKALEKELSSMFSKPQTLEKEKEALQSIKSNTKALQNINLRNYTKRK